MNRDEIQRIAERLDASGVHFAKGELDRSGNRTALVPVSWEAVIGRIIGLTGWRIVVDTHQEATVLPMRRE